MGAVNRVMIGPAGTVDLHATSTTGNEERQQWGGREGASPVSVSAPREYLKQTCHSDMTQNLNESEKKSEYAEKSLNLTIKIGLLYSNLYQIQSQKKSEFGVRLSEFH